MAPKVPQLALREEKRHLAGGGLRGVGGVDRVPLLGLGVELPHRAGLRFGGVGRADHLPQARDGVVPLERESQTGPRRHEGYQGAVKGTLPLPSVEALGLRVAQLDEAARAVAPPAPPPAPDAPSRTNPPAPAARGAWPRWMQNGRA